MNNPPKYPLFSRVALAVDMPTYKLYRGDIGTIVEQYEPRFIQGKQEVGYELEFFDALGASIHVVTVAESQTQPLRHDTVLSMRELHTQTEMETV
jgi:hypothetical protein